MNPLTSDTLQGTWSTLLLPLDESDSIEWEGIDRQLDALSAAGVDGIYFNGTASEFFTQNEEEFLRLARTTAAYCEEKGIPFQIGASHAHASDALKRIERTRELNPGAYQVILPEWTPLNWSEIIAFLRRVIATAAPIPIVIYNPPNARKVLTPEEWDRLSREVDGIIGMKVAGGDAAWHEAMRPSAEKLAVFVAGIRLASGTINGCASGSYSNLACLSPRGAVQWGKLIFDNPTEALRQEAEIQSVFATAIAPYRGKFSNTALDKALASAGGWAGLSSAIRWPLSAIPQSEIPQLAARFREGLPFLFEEADSVE